MQSKPQSLADTPKMRSSMERYCRHWEQRFDGSDDDLHKLKKRRNTWP